MKHLIRIALAAASLIGLAASAQDYGYVSVTGLPATITTGSTSNTTITLDVRKAENVALQFSFANGGTGTGNITTTIKYSVDGVTFAAAPAPTWVLAATADTNTYVYATNFATAGYGYMQISSIASASGSTLTVNSLKYSLKLLSKSQ